jgi:hypothetical protein
MEEETIGNGRYLQKLWGKLSGSGSSAPHPGGRADDRQRRSGNATAVRIVSEDLTSKKLKRRNTK